MSGLHTHPGGLVVPIVCTAFQCSGESWCLARSTRRQGPGYSMVTAVASLTVERMFCFLLGDTGPRTLSWLFPLPVMLPCSASRVGRSTRKAGQQHLFLMFLCFQKVSPHSSEPGDPPFKHCPKAETSGRVSLSVLKFLQFQDSLI